jgi:hypothetical protein
LAFPFSHTFGSVLSRWTRANIIHNVTSEQTWFQLLTLSEGIVCFKFWKCNFVCTWLRKFRIYMLGYNQDMDDQ